VTRENDQAGRMRSLLPAFRAFDEAFVAETDLPPPADIEASIGRLSRLIDKLPQRPAIQDEHVRRWIERTLAMSIERMDLELGEGNYDVKEVHGHALWHVRRASGIGGSEIGMLVRHFRGESGGFGSARNLVLEKLLVLAPTPPTPEMARGTRAEPWVQMMYHRKHGVRSDTDALDKLRGFRWERSPYLAGTPDDIVLPVDPVAGTRRRLVDYKAPSADVCKDYESKGISFDYQCQLHHYAILSLARGERFAEMSIEVHDPRTFDITSYPVAFDRALAKEITAAARAIWIDNVMTGHLPDPAGLAEMKTDDPDMIELGHQASMFRVLKEIMEAREKECIDRLVIIGSEGFDQAVGKIDLTVAALSRTRVWDAEALRELAKASGVDVTEFETRTEKFDAKRGQEMLSTLIEELRDGDPQEVLREISEEGLPAMVSLDVDALAARLEAAGVEVSDAASLKQSFTMMRKKKGAQAEALSRLKAEAVDLSEAIEDVVSEKAQAIILGLSEEGVAQPD